MHLVRRQSSLKCYESQVQITCGAVALLDHCGDWCIDRRADFSHLVSIPFRHHDGWRQAVCIGTGLRLGDGAVDVAGDL